MALWVHGLIFSMENIYERVDLSKVRDLQPATLETANTFTGIFQGFCLI